jgi:hypothetical protein
MKDLFEDILIYNKFIIINFFGFFRDIINFLYLRKSFKKIAQGSIWKDKKFRLDWVGMGYGVFNYDEQFFELSNEHQKGVIISDLKFLFDDFEKYNFIEILTLKQERVVIDGEYTFSILIYFRPIFYYTSFWNVINTLFLSVFIYLYFKDFIW